MRAHEAYVGYIGDLIEPGPPEQLFKRTYCTTVRGTSYYVVVEIEVLVEHLGVVLHAPEPFVAELFPARPGVGRIHCERQLILG